MKAKERQELFNYMSNEHGLHLVENELDEIERILGDKRDYANHVLNIAPITYENACKCKPDETTGCISEFVCNNCGRVQRK